jgi:hypothetical protein
MLTVFLLHETCRYKSAGEFPEAFFQMKTRPAVCFNFERRIQKYFLRFAQQLQIGRH